MDNPGKNSPRALGVWPAHENGHMMSVGTRGNYCMFGLWVPIVEQLWSPKSLSTLPRRGLKLEVAGTGL